MNNENKSYVDNKDLGADASKSYNKNKRQVYIWTENKEFFDNLRNKSKFVNLMVKKYRAEVGDNTLKEDE